ncbi:MAG: hypothetical protein ACRDRR_22375 [Pseudonocardiaceae bacterium]
MLLTQPCGHQRDEYIETPPRHRIVRFSVVGPGGVEHPAPLIQQPHCGAGVATNGSDVGFAHDGVEPTERGPLIEGDGLLGQQICGIEGRALVAQCDGRTSAHPHPGVHVAGSVGERGCVSVPGEGFGAVGAGKRLPVQSRQLRAYSPETRGVELLLKDDEVGGETFLDLASA